MNAHHAADLLAKAISHVVSARCVALSPLYTQNFVPLSVGAGPLDLYRRLTADFAGMLAWSAVCVGVADAGLHCDEPFAC
jgi:hypothetical protein